MPCPFCDPSLNERIYFREHGWGAFLDVNEMLPGHSIVARQTSNGCPDIFKAENLESLHLVLPKISDGLQREYGASNVLVTSLRGKVRHVHFHLLRWFAAWRSLGASIVVGKPAISTNSSVIMKTSALFETFRKEWIRNGRRTNRSRNASNN